MLRRYFSGYTLFGDFLIQEAEKSAPETPAFQELMREQSRVFDRLLAAVTSEYAREEAARAGTSQTRRAERLQLLLDGELLDTKEFDYDFEAHHVGAVAAGARAEEAIRALAATLDRRLLTLRRSEEAVWAWMGGRREFQDDEISTAISRRWPQGVSLALGEPAAGFAGWRLTHQQAKVALPIALRSPQGVARYGNVALLASMLQDELLATSLREIYLRPLEGDRDGGQTARRTLRAYFAAERNVSSAAAALGVSRQTVNSRLRAIEGRIGRSLERCSTEVDAALRLHDLHDRAAPSFPE